MAGRIDEINIHPKGIGQLLKASTDDLKAVPFKNVPFKTASSIRHP
jgi:hypothetical protein